jgi:signal transduction histidine kinase
MRDISLDEVSYQINKNILIIILVSIIFFIVVSKTVDSITLGDHRLAHKKTNSNRYYDEYTN